MTDAFLKDPDATLDYAFDWSSWMQTGETISTHTVAVPVGITVQSHTATGTVVTVWLTGGSDGSDYSVTCHVTTSAGRQDDRSMTIKVRSR